MVTLQELKLRNLKLKGEAESRKDLRRIGMERKALERENRLLRNPKKVAFFRGVSRGVRLTARGIGSVSRKVAPIVKRGIANASLARERDKQLSKKQRRILKKTPQRPRQGINDFASMRLLDR